MKRVVLGTAGHIDHGKTTLIKALTGVDCDRLKEEKERGITIELGFTSLTLPSGLKISIVDVPGHEKFVRHMVAGATGMDLVVLIVAADDAVFGYPPARVWGTPTTAMWVYRMGLEQAKRYLLTGDEIPARKAAEIGRASCRERV